MRELNLLEPLNVAAGVWCTYEGKRCSHCANLIYVEGDDCSIIKSNLNVSQPNFDAGGYIFSAGVAWTGFIVSAAASSAFGLGLVASGGIGIVFSLAVGAGYALSQRSR